MQNWWLNNDPILFFFTAGIIFLIVGHLCFYQLKFSVTPINLYIKINTILLQISKGTNLIGHVDTNDRVTLHEMDFKFLI